MIFKNKRESEKLKNTKYNKKNTLKNWIKWFFYKKNWQIFIYLLAKVLLKKKINQQAQKHFNVIKNQINKFFQKKRFF